MSAQGNRRPIIARTAAVVAAMLLAAACSSTAQRDQTAVRDLIVEDGERQAGTDGVSGDDAASGEEGEHDLSETEAAAPRASATDGADGGGGGVAGTSGDGASAGSATAGPSVEQRRAQQMAQGVTESTIKIGVIHYDPANAAAAGAAFGNSAADELGDTKGMATIMANHINANGGMAGRKVEVVYFEQDTIGGVANVEAEAQRTCSYFTEDHKVFAVVNAITGGDALGACLNEHNTSYVMENFANVPEGELMRLGTVFLPGNPNATRAARFSVARHAERGFFEGGTLGVVRPDRPLYDEIFEQGLAPALARQGVRIAEDARITWTNSSHYQSTVLRFKAQGIDRVVFLDVGGLLSLQFMQAAESQQFRPRYAFNSVSSLTPVVARSAPPNQLRDAIAVGWVPTADVEAEHAPPRSPAAAECLRIIHAGGQQTKGTINETAQQFACAAWLFLKAGLDRAPDITPEGLRKGVAALGTDFQPGSVPAARYGPGRHDGLSAARNMNWNSECRCWNYTSDPLPVE